MIIFLLFNLFFYLCGLIVIGCSETENKKTIYRTYSVSTLLFTSLFFYLLWIIKQTF
jgi:hypothetical protein